MSYLSPGYNPKYYDGLEAVGATFGAATQTGANVPKCVQTPLSQVAVYASMNKLANVTGTAKGLAGPLTGLNINDEASVGSSNQTFARLSSTANSVKNVTQSVRTLQSARLSLEGSQEFFQGVIEKSFAPDSPVSNKTKTAEEILSSMTKGSISDLATMMSVASSGVTTAKQLVEGINEGLIGYSTQSSGAESDRLGPMGYSRERLLK